MPSFKGKPITQGHKILSQKTRVLGAAHSEDFVILGVTVLIQCQRVTDEWTDTATMAKMHEALHAVVRKNTQKEPVPEIAIKNKNNINLYIFIL